MATPIGAFYLHYHNAYGHTFIEMVTYDEELPLKHLHDPSVR